MELSFWAATDVGRKREHNEDNFLVDKKLSLFVVADGMGGHASGEVASRLAVETIVSYFEETGHDRPLTWPFKIDHAQKREVDRLVTSIKLANLKIHEEAQRNPACRGMGTTLVSTMFTEDALIVGHVGDSRVYRLREGLFDQLTEDHSLLNDYIKMKNLSPEEIAAFPHKNVIVRALGMKSTVQVDVIVEQPRLGDLYVLCSDGLSGMVTDTEIAEVVANERDLNKVCDRLIAKANANGGLDNVTVVAIRVEPE